MWPVVRMILTGMVAFGVGTLGGFAGELKAGDLKGTWTLVELNSQPVSSNAPNGLPTFMIKDQSIEGFDGCNSFSGRLDQPGSITSTRRGCPDGAVKIPLDLTDPMSHLKEGRIENDKLILPPRGRMPESVFKRVP